MFLCFQVPSAWRGNTGVTKEIQFQEDSDEWLIVLSQATCVGRYANAQASLQACVQASEIYSRLPLSLFHQLYSFND